MAETNDLTVRDVSVQEGMRFTSTGQVERETRYTYFVGRHGPFTLVYGPGEDTPEKVKADMLARGASLREILGG
jgi:hypothetical protein